MVCDGGAAHRSKKELVAPTIFIRKLLLVDLSDNAASFDNVLWLQHMPREYLGSIMFDFCHGFQCRLF